MVINMHVEIEVIEDIIQADGMERNIRLKEVEVSAQSKEQLFHEIDERENHENVVQEMVINCKSKLTHKIANKNGKQVDFVVKVLVAMEIDQVDVYPMYRIYVIIDLNNNRNYKIVVQNVYDLDEDVDVQGVDIANVV